MKTLTTKTEMKIRKLYDEGYGLYLIASKLKFKVTADQIEKAIIKTAQAKKETQPLTLESFINKCKNNGCTVIRYQ